MPLMSDSLRSLSSALIISALVIAGLVLGKGILIPFTLAVVLAFILSPIVRTLTRVRVPQALAVTLVMVGVLGAVSGFTGVVSNQMISLTAGIDGYRTNVIEKVRAITGSGEGKSDISRAADAVDALGAAIQKEMNAPDTNSATGPNSGNGTSESGTSDGTGGKNEPVPKTIIISQPVQDGSGSYMSYLKSAGEPVAQAALTLLFTLFLLAQHQDLRDRVVRVVGTDHMTDTTSAMGEAGERLSQLFLMQAILNASFGAVVGIALWIIGVPNAVLWGLVTAVMRFVPYIGSFLAAIPPILLAAAVDPGWGMLLATLAVFVIGEPLMGHVIEPLVLGKRAGISPFAMIASASFWTLLWGPVGLILAAPLTMTLIVAGRYVAGLEFFSVLLGDEPALSPPQELYHRLLSEDAASAAEQVETAVEASRLAVVQDSLIFPALALAAQDLRRSRLDKDQVADLAATSDVVLEMLGDEDETPERIVQRQSAPHVLVIPVRGTIDTISAKYFAKLVDLSNAADDVRVSASTGLTALSDAKSLQGSERPDVIILTSVSALDPQQLRFIVKRVTRDFSGTRVLIVDFRSTGDAQVVAQETDTADRIAFCRTPSAAIDLLAFTGEAPSRTKDTPLTVRDIQHVAVA